MKNVLLQYIRLVVSDTITGPELMQIIIECPGRALQGRWRWLVVAVVRRRPLCELWGVYSEDSPQLTQKWKATTECKKPRF